ncbi:hypothetical protein TrCOL_g10355 [Triparma columacea]|uniref:Uncharacterized protein n=1 Tax=Triparma columacea TaxID=722753 RepID=A0A9W7LDZ6_9STRA|nr:hypothetical protein TrCOL_g10355 [Triparma columacea]
MMGKDGATVKVSANINKLEVTWGGSSRRSKSQGSDGGFRSVDTSKFSGSGGSKKHTSSYLGLALPSLAAEWVTDSGGVGGRVGFFRFFLLMHDAADLWADEYYGGRREMMRYFAENFKGRGVRRGGGGEGRGEVLGLEGSPVGSLSPTSGLVEGTFFGNHQFNVSGARSRAGSYESMVSSTGKGMAMLGREYAEKLGIGGGEGEGEGVKAVIKGMDMVSSSLVSGGEETGGGSVGQRSLKSPSVGSDLSLTGSTGVVTTKLTANAKPWKGVAGYKRAVRKGRIEDGYIVVRDRVGRGEEGEGRGGDEDEAERREGGGGRIFGGGPDKRRARGEGEFKVSASRFIHRLDSGDLASAKMFRGGFYDTQRVRTSSEKWSKGRPGRRWEREMEEGRGRISGVRNMVERERMRGMMKSAK